MEILRRIELADTSVGSVVTIGSFDGIHRGHQALLQETEKIATMNGYKSVVLTFDPHPQILLRAKDKRPIRILSSLEEKEFLITRLFDIDIFLVLDFTAGFSEMTAQQFVEDILVNTLNVRHVVIGHDHRFGHDRVGDFDFLKACGESYGFEVTSIGPIKYDDEPTSSTNIRDAIQNNDLEKANRLLGHSYTLFGEVVRGAGRGHKLNFPTANIQPKIENKLIPPRGVYLAKATVAGLKRYGMCNIGIRPTFEDHLSHDVVEINLFDWKGDRDSLYHQEILVEFYQKIREEKTFASPQDLMTQLEQDRVACLEIIKNI
ncbi:MAG TPA: riboflavin biosynthesis protein RibF [Candidatus Marinimicrobia bacterium]|nr:MAG: riboflavin biosynthesis protein RibF [Candidatus Marinimicrobia bacterium CG1_02_48_14]PIZ66199.1 MAG: riboflavin biosynthesis protein RibF [Candidatus Marinimicrobia bacterium CG_4_10_14_0_2_um_filter_48_9]HCW75402.1 riboflavin biosynthesis protein RibF [Candidatus Neomarinimicrobiota bacterium]